MERLEDICAALEELLTKYRKVGSAHRTLQWIDAARGTISSLCIKLADIRTQQIKPVSEEFDVRADKAASLINECLITIGSIAVSGKNSKIVIKMGSAFDLVTASRLIKEYDGKSSARDYVDSIEVYNDSLAPEGSVALANFIYKSRLKEDAKKAFLSKPATVEDISSVLLKRFRIRETVAGLNQKLSSVGQGNGSVSKFASVVEGIMADLIELQISKRGESAREVVQSISDESACDAFKVGLRPELQGVVLASEASTFSDALDKALQAEASIKDTTQLNAYTGNRYNGNRRGNRGANRGFRGNSRFHSFSGQQPRWGHYDSGQGQFNNYSNNKYNYRGQGNHGRYYTNTAPSPARGRGGQVHSVAGEQQWTGQISVSDQRIPQVNIAEEQFFRL